MKPFSRNAALLRWHRVIGAAAALLVLILALSGIALNHSSTLGLDRMPVSAPWLMRWYGLSDTPSPLQGYSAGAHWVSEYENRLLLDGKLLPHAIDGLVGAVLLEQALVIAGGSGMLLLAEDGALIERITALPKPVAGLGVTAQERVALRTVSGRIFTSDAQLLEWQSTREGDKIEWSEAESLPVFIREQTSLALRGDTLSLERIVLDLHSGRIFGTYGPWLMDIAAVMLLILAATGIIGWWRGRNSNGGGA